MDYIEHEPIKTPVFLEQGEVINNAITEYNKNPSEETFNKVMYSIYSCMMEDGHFIVPVDEEVDEHGETTFLFKNLELEDGSMAAVAFTTKENFEKAPESGALSNFIDSILEAIRDNEYYFGVVINPWAESFFLTKDMISLILEAKNQPI